MGVAQKSTEMEEGTLEIGMGMFFCFKFGFQAAFLF